MQKICKDCPKTLRNSIRIGSQFILSKSLLWLLILDNIMDGLQRSQINLIQRRKAERYVNMKIYFVVWEACFWLNPLMVVFNARAIHCSQVLVDIVFNEVQHIIVC